MKKETNRGYSAQRRAEDRERNYFANPTNAGVKKAKQAFNGSHHRQIEKELARPFVFLFVPQWKDGKIVKSNYKTVEGRVLPQYDRNKSRWMFNPILAAAGYKESDFRYYTLRNGRTNDGPFNYKTDLHLIYGIK